MIKIQTIASSSKGNCHLINDGSTQILLDCGIAFKEIQKALDFKTSGLAGILISHEHGDHAKGIKDAIKAGIDCFMTQGTADALGVNGYRVRLIQPKTQFKLGTWIVLPFNVQHDAADPVGFLLANQSGEKQLYATDTYYIRYRFNGLTHIMIEVNHSRDILEANVRSGVVPVAMKKRLLRSHMNLETAKDFLRANDLSKVQEIHLIHLSDGNSDEARFKREIQALTGKMVFVAQA